jgi:hypothetical protein
VYGIKKAMNLNLPLYVTGMTARDNAGVIMASAFARYELPPTRIDTRLPPPTLCFVKKRARLYKSICIYL